MFIAFLNYVCNKIALSGLSFEDIQRDPLKGWRKSLRDKSLFVTSKIGLILLGFYWVNVKGKPARREDAPVVVGNHTSWIDPILFESQQICSPVSKIENSKVLFVGTLLLAIQSVLVERESKEKRGEARELIINRAKSNKKWDSILIYPEGTCTNGKTLIKFKQGAFASGLPVQPAVVSFHRNKFFDPSFPHGLNLFTSMCLCMVQFVNYVDITYLPVYNPNEQEKKDPVLFSENVRQEMAKELNIPLSKNSFEDLLKFRASNEQSKIAKTKTEKQHKENTKLNPVKKLPNDSMAKEIMENFAHSDKDCEFNNDDNESVDKSLFKKISSDNKNLF
eukprot:TRINITY_DN2535_c0_g1_i1.p1 TRINITY_DN2535_c0_g1~~TRINITY_DN2535_c0_g1_i1.p1  ORF type:complete len:335 (-),score=77.28 TRINITY_DN2535_c0_g1_i1:72-1076(-)